MSPTGKVPAFVQVKKSGISGAGMGVFANIAIPTGAVMGVYRGRKLTIGQAQTKRLGRSYLFDVKAHKKVHHVIDGAAAHMSSWPRYVNCAPYEKDQNACFIQKNYLIYIKAVNPIGVGDEILAWYGSKSLDVIKQK